MTWHFSAATLNGTGILLWLFFVVMVENQLTSSTTGWVFVWRRFQGKKN